MSSQRYAPFVSAPGRGVLTPATGPRRASHLSHTDLRCSERDGLGERIGRLLEPCCTPLAKEDRLAVRRRMRGVARGASGGEDVARSRRASNRPLGLVSVVLVLALLSACRVQEPLTKAGVDLFEEGKFKDASAAFEQALMNAPSSEAHLGKASATHQLGEFDEAAEQFRRVLSTTDDALRARAWFDLGVNEAKGGRLDGAIEALRRSLEIVPDDPDARYDLEWVLRAKQQQEQQKKDQKDGDKSDGKKSEGDKSDDKKDSADQKQDEQKQGDSKQDGQQPKPDEQKAGGSEDDAKKDEPQPGKDGEEQQPPGDPQKSGEQPQAGAPDDAKDWPPPKAMNAQKAAAVLDALQGGEKSLQMWRFQKQADKQKGGDVAQDW